MNKEQLQKDIEAMRAKLKSMEEELSKPEEFKWEYGWEYGKDHQYYISNTGVGCDYNVQIARHLDHGNYRAHERNAIEALQLTKETKLIGAIAEQVKGGSGTTEGLTDYFYISQNVNRYQVSEASINRRILGVQYMDEKTATKVCEILNSGQVKL